MGQLNRRVLRAQPIPARARAQQLAHCVAELVLCPLRIVRTLLIRVADRHGLYVGLPQEVEHHPQPLRTSSDECNVDLVAGRNIAGPAQYVARNDGQTGHCRGGSAQEPPPGKRILRSLSGMTGVLHFATSFDSFWLTLNYLKKSDKHET